MRTKRIKKTSTRKTFVLDTSVILYDRNALTSFPGNDVVIPIIVLDELDRFKDKTGIVGENARHVNRFLDKHRSENSKLCEGVMLEEIDQTIRVEVNVPKNTPDGLESNGDNKIISVALALKEKDPDRRVIMVTKDINFRVKCDALGLEAEDYYKDSIKFDDLPGEMRELSVLDTVITDLYIDGYVPEAMIPGADPHASECFIIRSELNKSALCIFMDKKYNLVSEKSFKMNEVLRIKPKNKEQVFALYMLLQDNINLVTLTGIAGSGKTFLALMAGLSGLYDKKYKRIVITRPIQTVGKDIGFLPGDVHDKMAVWIKPIVDNFKDGTNNSDDSYFEMMMQKGQIEVAPLPFIRGRTFNDAFIIVDEAQNASIHELKTIITRVGRDSKIVLLGDTDQVDTPYLDTFSNGLTITVDRFKDQVIAGHISLPKSERSELAAIASTIL